MAPARPNDPMRRKTGRGLELEAYAIHLTLLGVTKRSA